MTIMTKTTASAAVAALTGVALMVSATTTPAAAGNHAAAAALGGFAVGTIFGAAAAQPRYYAPAPVYVAPAPVYVEPAPVVYYDRHDARCVARYRSYNPATNTWVDFQGRVRYCRL